MVQFLLLVALVSSVTWTVTQEELFREWREWCKARKRCRKFFYLFTCNFCFSHWVTLFSIQFVEIPLWLRYDATWRRDYAGDVLWFFAVVWVSNIVMSLYGLLRQFLKLYTARGIILADKAKNVQSRSTRNLS